jgi:hypothetical protein
MRQVGAIFGLLALAGCVTPHSAAVAGRAITIDGVPMSVRQVDAGTTYGYVVDAGGNSTIGPTGQGRFIAVAGARDKDMAIRAYGAFCGQVADPARWDTDQVPVAPDTGEYQFGGDCG